MTGRFDEPRERAASGSAAPATPSRGQEAPITGGLSELCHLRFEDIPEGLKRRVHGVPYAQLDDATGGRLWVTRHGWQILKHLDPANWYLGQRYVKRGTQLSGGSGTVYRVPSGVASHGPVDLVVKFSRIAQGVPLQVSSRFPSDVPRHVLDAASFNDPFQEFGLLEDLRGSRVGPGRLRIRTKRPVAIYSPGRRFAAWQLGRREDLFRTHQARLAKDQAQRAPNSEAVEMEIDRQYVYLFHWVRGDDAQSLFEAGVLSAREIENLVVDVVNDLAAKGFRVLDTKPNHIILRRRADGQLLKRNGRLVYALVDFELLQRTERYTDWLKLSGGV